MINLYAIILKPPENNHSQNYLTVIHVYRAHTVNVEVFVLGLFSFCYCDCVLIVSNLMHIFPKFSLNENFHTYSIIIYVLHQFLHMFYIWRKFNCVYRWLCLLSDIETYQVHAISVNSYQSTEVGIIPPTC